MTWLVWKDFRVNRLVFIVAAFLFVLPFVIPVVVAWYLTGIPIPTTPGALERNLIGSCIWSLGLLQLMMAFIGGNAIAGERLDRSAEFLAYLPVSRGRLLASKLLVVLGLVALIWLPNLAILSTVLRLLVPRLVSGLELIATTGLTFFCVAWLFSALLQSPVLSVCLGLLPPIITGIWIAFAIDASPPGSDVTTRAFWWYHGICLSLSAVSFAGGTFYYLRRVEP
jgi:ABC-type transport system involved in multi-copper enzyme maturation permease subunit